LSPIVEILLILVLNTNQSSNQSIYMSFREGHIIGILSIHTSYDNSTFLLPNFRWGVLDTTLCDKICQWLGQWFSPGTPVSSTNKTGRHDITDILLKVALNTINQINQISWNLYATMGENICTCRFWRFSLHSNNYILIHSYERRFHLLNIK